MADLRVLDGPKDNLRQVKSYQPSMWSDIFSSFSFDNQVQEMYLQQIEVLKEEVKMMLMSKESKIEDRIILIDTIERLGVSYHFEQQIEEQIEQIFIEYQINFEKGNYDLFATALGFRLFRQHGHNSPCSVFVKFKGKDNKFDINLSNDIKGLLSLYEATYLMFHGEDILEEAMVFTKYYLNVALPKLDSFLQVKIKQALEQPTRRGVQRVETRNYISIYENEESKNHILLRLAKLDFNYVQNIFKKELRDLLMWWKEMDLISKLPHVRERVVECYFWAVVFNFEPMYSLSRLANAKALILLTIINDTYDHYATFQETESCTENLQRWDIKEIDDQLPEYMKIICRFFISTYEEFENEDQIKLQGRSYAVTYAREAMQQLAKGYSKKALWQLGKEVPTFEDYMSYAVINSVCYLLISSSFMGMESATKEYFEWLNSEPEIVKATGLYGRYMNDVASYQRESKEGLLATSIDCYMKEHAVSKQETIVKFVELAEDCWMTINEERVATSNYIPSHIIERVLNYSRGTFVTYNNGEDGYTNPEKVLMPYIIALFKDPITII
ncbi:hypothetical protein ACJIZ3_019956 [Penstemon smallii]|uniref:Uncharacterized protein n=1 Tax=Penstemon smallii TaxID=265156 RepID=A0ABD3T2M3_9LAMI